MKPGVARVTTMAVLALACPPLASHAQQTTEATSGALKDTLTRLEERSWTAWQGRDGSYFETFLSNDHVEVGVAGPAGKSTIVSGVTSPSCVVKSFALDSYALTIFDANTALLTYHAQQDTVCGGVAVPSPVWVSSLYLKRGERWQNALYQQTLARK